ncbi:filamentous hemagglutinin N-terminal domain-containing protein [Candidatus Albibeggiatoa sp. nov. NOAA]|uniref:two-partner secretion domain-containing protein n=1 Tax=Candidatus Albibeggiatoa sp. nov. NOAA TaxID=3162724 RepID=UPI0032F261AB|nr:filamentous hemagglutinin N-terminal domain-containing protein [Thiotrichaceae bacterium]
MRYFIILCLLFSSSLHAEVILDGSLGERVELTGSNYEITESLGTRAGNNLFHSFESFNLSEGEIATFSGSEDIFNVISRVTGGSPSLIDGTIASTMPDAFFYFINPYGVAFGPNSSLDVGGSFHISTAHVLRFPDGNDFDTINTENTLLSIEEPSAFGFLSDNVAPIAVQRARLSVPAFRTLSFIGNQPTFLGARLSAGIGQLYIIGVGGEGDVSFKTNFVSSTEFFSDINTQVEQLADVKIQSSLLSVSGAKGGNVYIRGGQVVLESSRIAAETGNFPGGVIDIQAQDISLQAGSELIGNSRGSGGHVNMQLTAENNLTIQGETIRQNTIVPSSLNIQVEDAESGHIQLKAKNIQLLDGGSVFASSRASGQGGNITIEAAERIDITGTTSQGVGSQIGSNSRGEQTNAGNGGTIALNADSILIADGAQIGSLTSGAGDGGHLSIKTNTLTVTGQAERIDGNVIPSRLTAITTQSGQGGSIQIETTELNLQDNAQITASSVGTGDGGTITVEAQTVTLSASSPDKQAGSIIANSRGEVENAGRGGNIDIKTEDLTILNGGQLTSSVTGSGQGGNISLEVAKVALFAGTDPDKRFSSGVLSLTTEGSTGDAGTIRFKTTGLLLDDNAQINAQTRGAGLGGDIAIQAEGLAAQRDGRITAQSLGTGDAGSLILDIGNTLVLNQGGAIQTSTESADGGNVIVDVKNYLFIRNGELSTSVGADVGNGGNITLNSKFTVLHNSPIIARAFGGNGGNIDIVTRSLYKMEPNFLSPIDASSRFGLDGVVTISTPDVGSDEGLLVLPENFTRADVILPQPCGSDVLQSSFVLQDRVGITPLQSDWQPAHF